MLMRYHCDRNPTLAQKYMEETVLDNQAGVPPLAHRAVPGALRSRYGRPGRRTWGRPRPDSWVCEPESEPQRTSDRVFSPGARWGAPRLAVRHTWVAVRLESARRCGPGRRHWRPGAAGHGQYDRGYRLLHACPRHLRHHHHDPIWIHSDDYP